MRKLYIVPDQNYITLMSGDTVNVAQPLQTIVAALVKGRERAGDAYSLEGMK